jgi:hypothetical protein
MGIFMVTVWVPNHKGVEMAKLYLKQPREIPYVTKWRVFNTTGGLDGAKQYHIIYTERGKAEEAAEGVMKYFMPFSNEIEGFHWQVESLMGVSDTYKMMGMKW